MTLTPGTFVRCGLLAFCTVIIQLSAFGPGRIFGGYPDVIVLVVAAVAIYAGSIPGSIMGFAMGFLVDLLIGTPMGSSSLVLTAVGYGVGRYSEVRDPAHGLLPIPVGAIATAAWVLAFAAVSFMLDIEAEVSGLVFREMFLTVLLNTFLAMPVFWVCRKVLRPSLIVDPVELRRRRRGPTDAGPIGLRGLEV